MVVEAMAERPLDRTVAPPNADALSVWQAFAPPLRAFLATRVPAGVDADDLVQDVFVRVIRHLGTLRSTERPEAWLFQIARNALRDTLRARQRRDGRTDALEIDVPDDGGRAGIREAEAELAPCLTAMIGRLAEPYRSAIELTSVQGLTQSAAAKHAGISLSGMKSRVQRGRAQLRQMLVDCCVIALDVRGGVTDFHRRRVSAAAGGGAAVPSDGCSTRAACVDRTSNRRSAQRNH